MRSAIVLGLAAPLVLAVIGCGGEPKKVPPETLDGGMNEPPPTVGALKACGGSLPTDFVQVSGMSLVGDNVAADVLYTGGCVAHGFEMCHAALMGSNPARVQLMIGHSANGDKCKESVRRQVHFDLTPLRAAYKSQFNMETGTIRVVLDAHQADYKF